MLIVEEEGYSTQLTYCTSRPKNWYFNNAMASQKSFVRSCHKPDYSQPLRLTVHYSSEAR